MANEENAEPQSESTTTSTLIRTYGEFWSPEVVES
jgi:hypothetical protein